MSTSKRPSILAYARRPRESTGEPQPTAGPSDSAPAIPVATQAANQAKPGKPGKHAAKSTATIRHACGHEKPLKDLENRKCGPCREADQKAKRERKRMAREAKRQAGPAKAAVESHGRLPDKSRFDVQYDADAQTWRGTLAVVGVGVFTASASGVFRLLTELDRMYREKVGSASVEAGK